MLFGSFRGTLAILGHFGLFGGTWVVLNYHWSLCGILGYLGCLGVFGSFRDLWIVLEYLGSFWAMWVFV